MATTLPRDLIGASLLALIASCTRINPDFGLGADVDTSMTAATAGGDSATATAATADPLDTSDGPSTAADSSGAPDDSGDDTSGGSRCGDGTLDADEQCDDGNTLDDAECNAQCRIPGKSVWSVDFQPLENTDNRFNAIAPFQGALFATGRGTVVVDGPTELVVVRINPATGAFWAPLTLGPDWLAGEGLAIDTTDNVLYVSGAATTDGNGTGVVARFDAQGPGLPLLREWTTSVDGDTSPGLLVSDTGILVALSRLNGAGYGLELLADNSSSQWEWFEHTEAGQSHFGPILSLSNNRTIVSGTLEGDAILADVENPLGVTEPFLSLTGTGTDQDRFQSIVGTPDALFVGGWLSNTETGPDAWIGRCSFDANCAWERVFRSDADEIEEIHQIALDGAGNIVAVGLSGATSTPTIWKITADGGEDIWSRQYPEHGPGVASFRGVVVDGDIFVVGESQSADGVASSKGIAMRLNP